MDQSGVNDTNLKNPAGSQSLYVYRQDVMRWGKYKGYTLSLGPKKRREGDSNTPLIGELKISSCTVRVKKDLDKKSSRSTDHRKKRHKDMSRG